jgi:choice-of-anchor C domain-containing protein
LLDGWVVTRATVDYIGGAWPGLDGACSLDLDGTPGFGGVAQDFVTTPGQEYRISFSMAGNPLQYDPSEPDLKLMRVSAAGSFADFSFLTDVNDNSWESHEWFLTALGAQTTLEFYSLDAAEAGYSGFFGPALDNVVVTAVPEPATGVLVAAGIALLAVRRARS